MSVSIPEMPEVSESYRLIETGIAIGLGSLALKIIAKRIPVAGELVSAIATAGELVGVTALTALVYSSMDKPVAYEQPLRASGSEIAA